MTDAYQKLAARSVPVLVTAVAALSLAACSSTHNEASKKPTRSKEYFAESEYGVKASPRVSTKRSGLPRGGGREQVGKPYQVKGKWYHPKEKPAGHRSAGIASWYGDAFHGRLTANGEVYDMTHLTAAHPTMPLPSYARVTNSRNGSSVIVRVNDRGPFAHGRVIDLSRRAAELLDYTHVGVAHVDVEYIGRAPLHGEDDEYLMASYRPGGAAPDPSDGLPSGVMIAMNGATPTTASSSAPVFPGQAAAAAGDPVLPDIAPIAPARPFIGLANRLDGPVTVLGYADARVKGASLALDRLADGAMTQSDVADALVRRYKGRSPDRAAAQPYVAVGTFADEASARGIAAALAHAGEVGIETTWRGDGFSVSLRSDGRMPIDDMLRAAWAAGASDAMTVRE